MKGTSFYNINRSQFIIAYSQSSGNLFIFGSKADDALHSDIIVFVPSGNKSIMAYAKIIYSLIKNTYMLAYC